MKRPIGEPGEGIMKRFLLPLLALLFLSPSAPAQGKREPLADRVRVSIDKAVEYLKRTQRRDGGWEVALPAAAHEGGWTSLAVLALLNSGVPASDPAVKNGLEYLRRLKPNAVYVRALQTMVFVEGRQKEDLVRIADNIAYLTKVGHGLSEGKLKGWSYNDFDASIDNSNTQYALLGLWSGSQADVKLKRDLWETIREYYLRTQHREGSWAYIPHGEKASLTMTTAGVSGLLIASMELALPCNSTGDGKGRACGEYPDQQAIKKGIRWVSNRFTVDFPGATFYHIYGLERLGRLTGERFIGPYDWYREGCEWLVKNQKKDGYFSAIGIWDQWPVVSTSFALLFLSKGRTPVLVSKLVHFNREQPDDGDWNNDRNDLRNLVSFSSKHLFKEMPLAWQSFDIPAALGGERTEDAVADAASELLQSPILYITGHKSPFSRLSTLEKQVIKRYVESGGFIFVEACCSKAEFDEGFKRLVKDDVLWPDNDLSELDSKHPVWSSHFLIKPGDPYPLYGVSMGCKTVLIYSPKDMSCFWEGNVIEGQGDRAFKLGTNILAYATGKVPPKPRLTEMEVVRGKDDGSGIRRGYLQVAQIQHAGDWKPAPQAMRNLMDHVNRLGGINVVRSPEHTRIYDAKVLKHKFLYMHGRGKFAFREAADEESQLDYLRFNLNNGGLLFADACCGNEEFDKSFREFAKQLFPKEKLERVPEDDILFSKKLTGTELGITNIRARTKSGEEPRPMAPYLEGIRIDGRWVVLYSKYDIGCALERHSSSDCLGYTPESAFHIATAAVMYSYWPAYKEEK